MGTPADLLPARVLSEVPAPVPPPVHWAPPRSPTSLYDACVLMSGVQDARSAMLMQITTRCS